MKAIGYKTAGSIDAANALEDIELDKPTATGRDILVKVSAIAVNPVDFKIRQNVSPTDDEFKVLGWDAVGEVVAVGEETHLFNHGDKVYYAGDLTRPGSNAEYQLVDERLVARKPASISDAEAAAMPPTSHSQKLKLKSDLAGRAVGSWGIWWRWLHFNPVCQGTDKRGRYCDGFSSIYTKMGEGIGRRFRY